MSGSFTIAQFSLRFRIFLAMIFLTLIASVLIASVSIYQFRKEARDYHLDKLVRKEDAITEHINYILATTPNTLSTQNLPQIFKEKIYELANIHGLEINIYDLTGNLLISSKGAFTVDRAAKPIPPIILKIIQASTGKRFVDLKMVEGQKYRSSYSYLKDTHFKPLAILNLPYVEETSYYENEVRSFLMRLGQVYLFMLLISFAIAYFLSSYITKSLQAISEKLQQTRFYHKNQRLQLLSASKEIQPLIYAYNAMVDELEASAVKLAQNEREQAWREMAKQVAHEIKNPLTPMRLTVQSFERKFDPNDPQILQKMKDFAQSLIQQIDTMSAVASAFSSFASLPAQQNETLNIVAVIQLALEIFNEECLHFVAEEKEIITKIDRTQLIRIITNLVKNALQSLPENHPNPNVTVQVLQEGQYAKIIVQDNGAGISIANKNRIFEPKFTTKSSGMGLGLGIIKNIVESYQGTIDFESEIGLGTKFIVTLPMSQD